MVVNPSPMDSEFRSAANRGDGIVPHTPKWLAHGTDWFNRRIHGEDPPGRIPIDALRILMQADDRTIVIDVSFGPA